MLFVIEALHQETGPTRGPPSIQMTGSFGEALGKPVGDPVGHVENVIEREAERMHGGEAVEIF